MSHSERGSRRITSIPPMTSLGVLRGVTVRIGRGSLVGGARRESREPTAEGQDWKIVAKHVDQKPQSRENARSGSLYERDGKIECKREVIEDYNGRGDLGIILQFSGIRLTETPFLKSRRDYGPDSAVFYTRIGYKNKNNNAYLILATRGDIFESQIVPAQMDVNPFFQEELLLHQLTTTHDLTSMTAVKNNELVIVGYNPHTY